MPESLTVLGIESSCDETAVAILRSAGEEKAPEILSSVISSQIAIHRQHGGVVPELVPATIQRIFPESSGPRAAKPEQLLRTLTSSALREAPAW